MDLKLFLRCLFSPSLYNVHRTTSSISEGKYDPNEWERWGDNLIFSFILFRHLTVYSSPFLIFLLAKRGYFTVAGALTLAKISVGLGVLVGASYCIRSYGRSNNDKYKVFLASLQKAADDHSFQNKKDLKNFDFEFSAWPIDYDAGKDCEGKPSVSAKRAWYSFLSPCYMFSYIIIHSFGIRLIYPGSIRFLGFILSPALQEGRHKLIKNENGERFKVKTCDGNTIDTMFLDKRNRPYSQNGSTLVICSEGNAGFYEIGIMATAIENGNSVLGWNHPGFAGSTGSPYTDQEENAVDAVLQFALNKLNFKPEDIVLFGWSIGGYSTALAALKYPDVKAVVIDASFDDLVPLAVARMPAFLEPIVRMTIRSHANLDVARKLSYYSGPLSLVRRSEDEVICIDPNYLSTNRGNHLLIAVLRQRYPRLFDQHSEVMLNRYLAVTDPMQSRLLQDSNITDERCKQIISSYLSVNGSSFPYQLGEGMDSDIKTQLLLYYASNYLNDYASTHCTPLPASLFRIPSHPSPDV